MTTITEGSLAFDFPADWMATKYDEWTFYINHFQTICGSAKAVDIVALAPNGCLWLIEIKDYRAGPRQKSIELVEEIALKVRDSLAGLTAARLRANKIEEASAADQASRCNDIKVALHMEQPAKPSRLHPTEDVSKLIQKLKQLLRAVDYHPRVTNLGEGNKYGWTVREI